LRAVRCVGALRRLWAHESPTTLHLLPLIDPTARLSFVKTLVWRLGLVPPRSLARTLSGAFSTASPNARPQPATELSLTYTIHQHSLSGLKVGRLTCPGMEAGGVGGPSANGGAGGGQKVFRGMRSRVECSIWKRW
jgi:hypothetical protein